MMTRKRLAIALAATTSLVGMSMIPAAASAQTVEQLQQQIDALQAQINELKAAQKKAADEGVKMKWEPAPSISSPDGRFEMNLRGRLLADAAWIDDDDGFANLDVTQFRAARLGIEGKAWNNVKYKFEVDFANDSVSVKDAYIEYLMGVAGLSVGQFKTYNSLDELISSRFTTFMERAAFTSAFETGRMLGLGLAAGGEDWTLSGGVFRGSINTNNQDEGEVFALRATYGPKIGDNGQVHVGAHYRYRKHGDDQANFRYRARPFTSFGERYVDTKAIGKKDSMYGVELAGVYGPFSAQGEYVILKSDLAAPAVGQDDPTFKGWYADLSWFITGESRTYEGKKGEFARVKVKNPVFEGGWGAWQIAARYDVIDLNDEGVFGGEQQTWIIGLNWYLNNYSRIMLNYSSADTDDSFLNAALNGADGSNKIDTLGMRFQVDW